jgi:cytosine/adenosine deaminase-related metal-dependent hydrolase
MSTLLVRNAEVLVTMDEGRRELKEAGLYAENGIIRAVGPTRELPAHADVVLDLSGQIVLPGFVNTHHHLDQTLTRNLPAAQNNNLFPWLQQAIRYQRKSRCNQPSSWHRVTGQADRIRPEFGHRLRRSLDW